MNILELLTYATAVIVMIATPGPVMLLVASAGQQGGYKKALETIFGTNFASLLLITASILVLKGVLSINGYIFDIIKVLGCAYIAFLGYEILKEVKGTPQTAEVGQVQPKEGGFKKGFLVGISNPKDIIFFSAFFPQFIHVTPNINSSLLVLTVVWIILDFATLSMVYLGFSRLSKSRHYPKLLGVCGLVLVAVALYGILSTIYGYIH